MSDEAATRTLRVPAADAGARLDRWLAARIPELSRARLQALIDDGHVRVDGTVPKPSRRLGGGEEVVVAIPPPAPETLAPEPIALTIVHEDADVLVIDKPAGMVVHPGAGHATGTLAAAVLAHAPGIAGVGGPGRPGVVHRLDKDTSGLLVLAKTGRAYDSLTAQLAERPDHRPSRHPLASRGAGVRMTLPPARFDSVERDLCPGSMWSAGGYDARRRARRRGSFHCIR